jgi:tRNA(Arg) A34 adenosine deaminase TadA
LPSSFAKIITSNGKKNEKPWSLRAAIEQRGSAHWFQCEATFRSTLCDSKMLHDEMHNVQNASWIPASAYRGCILYSSLLPCPQCSGVTIHWQSSNKIPHVLLEERTKRLEETKRHCDQRANLSVRSTADRNFGLRTSGSKK